LIKIENNNSEEKLELIIPKKIFSFYKARAILKNKKVKDEIKDFLEQERNARIQSDFQNAMFN
jgi:formate-dependent nitrite reductase cytochrome c552 subunit